MPKPKRLWTIVRLERACRRALTERGHIKFKALSNASAEVEWTDDGPIRATVDPLTVSHIAGVVHELVHPILAREMACFAEYWTNPATNQIEEDLGELAMNAWEEALLKFISTNRRRKEWWRKAIKANLVRR